MIEIMAPVGSYESLHAAIQAGASSVYFGVGKLNMRARAANTFSVKDLKKIVKICRDNNVKSYLTLNTVMYDEDFKDIKNICSAAKKAGVSAVIACDMSVILHARSIGLEVHLSTQANVSNIESVKFYSKFCDVVVLARELELKQIKKIVKDIKKYKIKGPSGKLVQIEIFVHGALCVSISGKCYMSLGLYNHSANRGDCLQACRRGYKVEDLETKDELNIENKYVMSPKDLCTIPFLDKILDSGVSVLKIEGRGRSPDYVYTVIKVYKECVEACLSKRFSKKKVEKWVKELSTVYNRGFWYGGYYLGKKLGEWAGVYGSKATKEKIFVGVVSNYFTKAKVGEFIVQSCSVKVGDSIMITGPTTGVVKGKVVELRVNDKNVNIAKKKDSFTMKFDSKLRKNDKLFVIKNKKN